MTSALRSFVVAMALVTDVEKRRSKNLFKKNSITKLFCVWRKIEDTASGERHKNCGAWPKLD